MRANRRMIKSNDCIIRSGNEKLCGDEPNCEWVAPSKKCRLRKRARSASGKVAYQGPMGPPPVEVEQVSDDDAAKMAKLGEDTGLWFKAKKGKKSRKVRKSGKKSRKVRKSGKKSRKSGKKSRRAGKKSRKSGKKSRKMRK